METQLPLSLLAVPNGKGRDLGCLLLPKRAGENIPVPDVSFGAFAMMALPQCGYYDG